MAIICPAITATNEYEYREQILNLKPFADRVHIDLMDGAFAPTVSQPLDATWWPHELQADIHLMYQNPMDYLDQLLKMKPRMVIVHNEVTVHHMHFAAELHKAGILAGLAILQETPVDWTFQIIHSFDHVLVFSGNLGQMGGTADLGLLDKVTQIRSEHPDVEIGWDGGVNADNAQALLSGGVDVLTVGGFIRNSEHPPETYARLAAL